ncbi:hypothetical protein IIA16_06920 [bacterium]|nr:hypothetical protein [bacterium]
MILLYLGGGILLLFLGGELAIYATVRLARRWRLADGLAGLSLTALMTSLPEIFTTGMAGFAAAAGEAAAGGVAYGNVLGSNAANALLLGGIGLIWGVRRKWFFRPAGMLAILAPVAVALLALNGVLTRLEGALLLLTWIFLIKYLYSGALASIAPEEGTPTDSGHTLHNVLILVASGALLWFGGRLALEGALAWVGDHQLDSRAVGAVIGLGTSLPELAVTLSALRQGRLKILEGNLIGSNILNPLVAMPASTLAGAIALPAAGMHLYWAVGGTVWFLWAATRPKGRLYMGVAAVLAYFLYLGLGFF